jgi:flagellin
LSLRGGLWYSAFEVHGAGFTPANTRCVVVFRAKEGVLMGLRINANVPALNAGRQAARTNIQVGEDVRQLASGLRINRAADDAAGLAIADRFNTALRQGQMELNNLQSGVNYAQTADAGLGAQQEAVQRIRELAVQASNGTLTGDQRAALNAEAQQLVEQVGAVAQETEYNGQNLLAQDTTVDLGVSGGVEISIGESTPSALGINTVNLGTQAGAQSAVSAAETALNRITENRGNLGAQMNGIQSAIEQRENGVVNAAESESRIRDLDVARASINRSRNQILAQAGLAALVQSNVAPQNALRLLGQ